MYVRDSSILREGRRPATPGNSQSSSTFTTPTRTPTTQETNENGAISTDGPASNTIFQTQELRTEAQFSVLSPEHLRLAHIHPVQLH